MPNGTATTTTIGDTPKVFSLDTALASPEIEEHLVNEFGDDRDDVRPGDRVLLIIENDVGFARFLLDTARDMGFKGLVTTLGATGLVMTRDFKPDAISLDIHLPDIAGWRVLERIKNDVSTRHLPICVISTDESRDRALSSGAFAFVAKPIQSRDLLDGLFSHLKDFIGRSTKNLLVVESDPDRRQRILEYIDSEDVQVKAVDRPEQANQALRDRITDCLVVSAKNANFADAMSMIGETPGANFRRLPLIVYGDDNELHDDSTWKRLSDSCTVRWAKSPDRLLDLTTFFLHRAVATLPERKRQLLLDLHQSDKLLHDKKVLIVDDDIRNIFALSAVLEEHEMKILSADNGRDAIRLLQENPGIDIVLMDIMMPEMDGYETMQAIRGNPAFVRLPIIALTAKAMKGDREKCLEAGASDYLAKPVNTEQLLSALRMWLHR